MIWLYIGRFGLVLCCFITPGLTKGIQHTVQPYPFLSLLITRAVFKPHVILVVSLVTEEGHVNLPQGFVWVCMGLYTLFIIPTGCIHLVNCTKSYCLGRANSMLYKQTSPYAASHLSRNTVRNFASLLYNQWGAYRALHVKLYHSTIHSWYHTKGNHIYHIKRTLDIASKEIHDITLWGSHDITPQEVVISC